MDSRKPQTINELFRIEESHKPQRKIKTKKCPFCGRRCDIGVDRCIACLNPLPKGDYILVNKEKIKVYGILALLGIGLFLIGYYTNEKILTIVMCGLYVMLAIYAYSKKGKKE